MATRFNDPTVKLGFAARPAPSNAVITCSFPVQHGGAQFTEDLRRRLRSHYSFPSETSVYVDSHASTRLADSPGRYYLDLADLGGPANMRLPIESASARMLKKVTATDKRPTVEPYGKLDSSARRDDWNSLYVKALESSQYFLTILTPAYFKSTFCQTEFRQAARINKNRKEEGRPALRFVALSLGTPKQSAEHEAALKNIFRTVEIKFVHSAFTPSDKATLEGGAIPNRLPDSDFGELVQKMPLFATKL